MRICNRVAAAVFACLALTPGMGAAAQDGFLITGNGVGPFNIATPFNRASITAGLPEAQVQAIDGIFESQEDPVTLFRAEQPDGSYYMFYPGRAGRLGQIISNDPNAHTARGTKVGDNFLDAYADVTTPPCQAAAASGALAGKVLCQAPFMQHVTFIFSGEGGPVEPNEKPERDVLKNWDIEAFLWRTSF